MGGHQPRFGSLQYWPRKRAAKAVPQVNWDAVKGDGVLGLIAFKVGMASAIVRDKTDKSLTANKKIAMPVTILEVPKLKLFSVRFYKQGIVMKDVIVSHDKELKRVLRVPKQVPAFHVPEGYDEIRVIAYPVMKDMFKKTPPMVELMVRGQNALEIVKAWIGKELSMKDILKWDLLDLRGLTRGKGLVGPVKRFGISLKSHKSEKGVRRPGSLGPWHPAHVTFRVAQAGQLGMFTRVQYNIKPITHANAQQGPIPVNHGFKHYGLIAGDYIVVEGSVQGAAKREIVITPALRPTRKMLKKKYEFAELKL
ncbi:MAG: 50S ribosomal protein L3 [Nanoarchaeota archaeon]